MEELEDNEYSSIRRETVDTVFSIITDAKNSGIQINDLHNHNQIDGIKGILQKIRDAKTVVELPHNYQKVLSFVNRHFGPRIQEELGGNPKRLSKLKTIYVLAPKTYFFQLSYFSLTAILAL